MPTVFLLLAPHALSTAAYLAAMACMFAAGTNRSAPDRWLATAGFVLMCGAGVATLAMLVVFPYRTADGRLWAGFAAHFVLLVAAVVTGGVWLGFHLA